MLVINGKMKVTVNALLHNASTKMCISSDIGEQLKLMGAAKQVSKNVLNNQVKTFETAPLQFSLASVNRKFNKRVSAYTIDRVTGNTRPINRKK